MAESVKIDWQASKEEWVSDVYRCAISRLRDDGRFPSAERLIQKFERDVEIWRASGKIRALINSGNEVAVACVLLNQMRESDTLHYEPKLTTTKKSIDFGIFAADGERHWVDVKTVAPRFEEIEDPNAQIEKLNAALEAVPENQRSQFPLLLSGVQFISNTRQLLVARFSFIQKTIDLEEKISLLSASERGTVRMCFCSSGEWHKDDLEDFSDFYFARRFRADDWSQGAIFQYMTQKNFMFRGGIDGFCFLQRKHDAALASAFVMDVKGPQIFGAD